MSQSTTQQYQRIDTDDDQTPVSAHDITMSAAGRAIRDLVSIEARNEGELPLTDVEVYQVQRLVESDTARACAMEVQG